jgi:hypothetical protein
MVAEEAFWFLRMGGGVLRHVRGGERRIHCMLACLLASYTKKKSWNLGIWRFGKGELGGGERLLDT